MSILPSFGNPPLLVGRARELGVLRLYLDSALAGHGSLVLIGGEAGIGKTALAQAVCREAAEQGALVLVGRCYDLAETPPYGPWTTIIERLPNSAGSIVGPALIAPADDAASESQAALFGHVRDFLTALARHHPLVLLFDDLHWADAGSLDLLRFIARRLAEIPVLALATYRVDDVRGNDPFTLVLPALVRESQPDRILLQPFSEDDTRALVETRYMIAEPDMPALVDWLHRRAEGYPFYILELLRTLEDEDVLHPREGRWIVGDLTQVHVPTVLRQVVASRLGRMDAEAQRLLAIAAVIGDEVPLPLWMAVSGVDEERLLDTVQRAVEAHVLAETDGTRVRFTHALIRQTLYEGLVPSLLPSRRVVWHRRIAEMLAAAALPDPDTVAYHFRQAGDARAAEWLIRAGERAHRAHAYATAADRFTAALAEGRDAEPSERGWLLFRRARMLKYSDRHQAIIDLDAALELAAASGDTVLTAYARADRGWLRCASGDMAGGLADLEAGVSAIEALPAVDYTRDPALAFVDPWHRCGTLVYFLVQVGRFTEARAQAARFHSRREAMAGMPGMGGSGDADAFYGEAIAHAALGDPDAARHFFMRAREAFRIAGNYWMARQTAEQEVLWVVLPYGANQVSERQRLDAEAADLLLRVSAEQPRLGVRRGMSRLLLLEGKWDGAYAAAVIERALFPTVANTYYGMLATSTLAVLAHERGDTAEAWRLVCEAMPSGPDEGPGVGRFLLVQTLQRLSALLAISDGDLQAGRAWLEAHDRWLDWSGAVLGRADGRIGWALYHRAAGNDERAKQAALQARIDAMQPRQPLALLTAERLLGELETTAGHTGEAAAHLDAAAILADAYAAPFEHALVLIAKAELFARTGRVAEALAHVERVRTVCAPLGATRILARADAISIQRAASLSRPPNDVCGLTSREVEVLRRIAGGMSNREIADDLSISVRTVNRHITNLYGKIGARNKADATAYALRGMRESPHPNP